MKILNNFVRNHYFASNFSFCRALTTQEEKDFKKLTNEAMRSLKVKDGIRMFKVFQTALPVEKGENLGIGKLNSKKALDYLKFMALYTGSNAVKIYPAGQMPRKLRADNYYCPYERASVTVGEDNINFFKLLTPEYGCLLVKSDIEPFIIGDDTKSVNFENELDYNFGADFVLIKKAYWNMISSNNPDAKKIHKEFMDFKENLNSDTLDRLAVAQYVRKICPILFKNFNDDSISQDLFNIIKSASEKQIDIFKFGKFLAIKNLKEAKEKLNKQGLELYGDCPIGFTEDEVLCFPDAFYPENITPGWGFRALKFDEISKEGSEANRLFKEKIAQYLEIFDGVRFDVGWEYISPKLYDVKSEEKTPIYPKISDEITKFIEKTAREIKGENYDTRKLMYECDANGNDFSMFEIRDKKPCALPKMENKTAILTSTYEDSYHFGWGNPDFLDRAGLKDYIIGTNNHDGTPLRALAEDNFDDNGDRVIDLAELRKMNISALSKSLKINSEWLSNPKNFVSAKFAELFQAKNHFLYFNDVAGNKKRTDDNNVNSENYRYKISENYEKEYHTALQENNGFNLAESIMLAMRAESLDLSMPELYEKIKTYAKVLREKGPKTKAGVEIFFK